VVDSGQWSVVDSGQWSVVDSGQWWRLFGIIPTDH